MAKLAGKIAVVTGGGKGIGAQIAKAMASEGASVVVNYAAASADAETVVQSIVSAGGKAIAVKADVSVAADAEALIESAVREFGRVDILVNNAGVYEFGPIESVTPTQFHRMFDVNVLGAMLVTQAAAKHLGEGASIINISTAGTTLLQPNTVIYTATKAAVEAVTGVLANELGARKIRVNAIKPGFVETEGSHAAGAGDEKTKEAVAAKTLLGRTGKPDDIAKVAVFLASEDAGFVTGQMVTVSGGLK